MKNKLHIMKAMPPVTDDEIRSLMDFDAVVRLHHLHVQPKINWLRGFRITMALSVFAGAAYLLLRSENDAVRNETEKIPPVETPVEPKQADENPKETQTTPIVSSKENPGNAKA